MIDSFFYALFTGSKNHMGGFLFNIGKFLAIIIKPQALKQTPSQAMWVTSHVGLTHTEGVCVCGFHMACECVYASILCVTVA